MDKKEFKQTTNKIFNMFSFKYLSKNIYKDYGLFFLKIKSYKSNYSDEYYHDSYIVFKDEKLELKENLSIDYMKIGSRLQNYDGSIFSFDYKKLDKETYTKQLRQIVSTLDNLILSSPMDYLKGAKLNYFNNKGKDIYIDIIGLEK